MVQFNVARLALILRAAPACAAPATAVPIPGSGLKHTKRPRSDFLIRTFLIAVLSGIGTTLVANATYAAVLLDGHTSYSTLAEAVAAASPGSVLEVDSGLYLNDFAVIEIPLTIVGIGATRPIFQADGLIPNEKGILITNADLTIRNIEFRDASVADNNGAGIRYQSGDLLVEDSAFIDNQNGILGGDSSGTVMVRNSEFYGEGAGGGLTHGIYVNLVSSLTVTDSIFRGTLVGHNIKSRAAATTISGNTLDDGVTGTTSLAIDLPSGGIGVIRNNTITQGPDTQNFTMVSYGAEGDLRSINSLLVEDNIFVNLHPGQSIGVENFTNISAQLIDNQFQGVATPLQGPGVIITNPPDSVPEPSAFWLIASACIGLIMIVGLQPTKPPRGFAGGFNA